MKASGYDGKIIIDVWDIVQYYYCPRKIYFLRTLGTPILKKRKMIEGKEEHLKKSRELKRGRQFLTIVKMISKQFIINCH
ncbi:MAG: hypothetical protein QXL46_04805 [Nitrososphaerales archaeon]